MCVCVCVLICHRPTWPRAACSCCDKTANPSPAFRKSLRAKVPARALRHEGEKEAPFHEDRPIPAEHSLAPGFKTSIIPTFGPIPSTNYWHQCTGYSYWIHGLKEPRDPSRNNSDWQSTRNKPSSQGTVVTWQPFCRSEHIRRQTQKGSIPLRPLAYHPCLRRLPSFGAIQRGALERALNLLPPYLPHPLLSPAQVLCLTLLPWFRVKLSEQDFCSRCPQSRRARRAVFSPLSCPLSFPFFLSCPTNFPSSTCFPPEKSKALKLNLNDDDLDDDDDVRIRECH